MFFESLTNNKYNFDRYVTKNEKHLTEDWLHKTIKYKHLFDVNTIDNDDVINTDIEE